MHLFGESRLHFGMLHQEPVKKSGSPLLRSNNNVGGQVVLNNLGMHKGEREVEGWCSELLFLPAYSLDFSAIEETFSKVKTLMRKTTARTRGALVEPSVEWSRAVAPKDAVGFFGHCGYLPAAQPS